MSEPYDLLSGREASVPHPGRPGPAPEAALVPGARPAPGSGAGPDAVPRPATAPEEPGEPAESAAGTGAAADADAVPGQAAPEPLGVALGATGNAEVDLAVERLRDADRLPVDGHIEVYEDVHRGLRDVLAALDENRG
ncbi:hypothetical protein [Actinacidiphila acididurans]|uniref:hypothetical protein n=1 Tax=Actinacidiphila acididurans TaxID=2784346 RepID=UPI001F3AD4A5|nr:hypothetical protein [Actinacidiphila acididurans]